MTRSVAQIKSVDGSSGEKIWNTVLEFSLRRWENSVGILQRNSRNGAKIWNGDVSNTIIRPT
jgi:hypothetical protein